MNYDREPSPLHICPRCGKHFHDTTICPEDGSSLIEVKPAKFAHTLVMDRYQLHEAFASGGWSSVYRGYDTSLNRTVAFKVLFSHLSWEPDSLRRFRQEAQAVAAISHPNVVSVFDFGVLPSGEPFIVMEYVDGQSLKELLVERSLLSWTGATDIFTQACMALQAAHLLGIIHRDVKPGNILIPSDPNQPVKLVDFGLAKIATSDGASLTQSGETIGTPPYMSPEQCMGTNIDYRSDIYSLGCVMYETLTGKQPFSGASMFDLMLQQVNHLPKTFSEIKSGVEIPQDLERIVMKCLMKAPHERYQSVQELLTDLQTISGGKRLPFILPFRYTSKQRRAIVILSACIGLVLLATIITVAYAMVPLPEEKNAHLRVLESVDNAFHVERPPGLANLAAEQSLLLPRHGVASRQIRKETKPDGTISYFYAGKLGGWNPISQTPFLAHIVLDPEKELATSAASYMGDVKFDILIPKGKRKTIEHVREVKTRHTEEGWLSTSVICQDGTVFDVLTSEDGRVEYFAQSNQSGDEGGE